MIFQETSIYFFNLYVKLRGVHEAGAEGVPGGFVGGVDAQLAKDILTVGGDGVDAKVSLGGNLLRGLTLRNGPDYLRLLHR